MQRISAYYWYTTRLVFVERGKLSLPRKYSSAWSDIHNQTLLFRIWRAPSSTYAPIVIHQQSRLLPAFSPPNTSAPLTRANHPCLTSTCNKASNHFNHLRSPNNHLKVIYLYILVNMRNSSCTHHTTQLLHRVWCSNMLLSSRRLTLYLLFFLFVQKRTCTLVCVEWV